MPYSFALMVYLMGAFYIVVAILKLIDLRGFVMAYRQYDLIAMRSRIYAYAYPFIELGLGVAYLLQLQLTVIALITLAVMTLGTVSVFKKLLSGEKVHCACLGTFFNIPLTKFTLFEDIVMGSMALVVIFREFVFESIVPVLGWHIIHVGPVVAFFLGLLIWRLVEQLEARKTEHMACHSEMSHS